MKAAADALHEPITYAAAAVNGFAWAHDVSGNCCRCIEMIQI